MRDHLPWKIRYPRQKIQHFNITEPVTKDHLSWETTFLWPVWLSMEISYTIFMLAITILYRQASSTYHCLHELFTKPAEETLTIQCVFFGYAYIVKTTCICCLFGVFFPCLNSVLDFKIFLTTQPCRYTDFAIHNDTRRLSAMKTR